MIKCIVIILLIILLYNLIIRNNIEGLDEENKNNNYYYYIILGILTIIGAVIVIIENTEHLTRGLSNKKSLFDDYEMEFYKWYDKSPDLTSYLKPTSYRK